MARGVGRGAGGQAWRDGRASCKGAAPGGWRLAARRAAHVKTLRASAVRSPVGARPLVRGANLPAGAALGAAAAAETRERSGQRWVDMRATAAGAGCNLAPRSAPVRQEAICASPPPAPLFSAPTNTPRLVRAPPRHAPRSRLHYGGAVGSVWALLAGCGAPLAVVLGHSAGGAARDAAGCLLTAAAAGSTSHINVTQASSRRRRRPDNVKRHKRWHGHARQNTAAEQPAAPGRALTRRCRPSCRGGARRCAPGRRPGRSRRRTPRWRLACGW